MSNMRLVAAACLLFLPFGPASALALTAKDIDRWSTDCTSGLTCSLHYENFYEEFGGFEIRRTGALKSEVTLWLPRLPGYDRTLDETGFFSFDIDGRELLRLTLQQLTFDAEREKLVLTDRAPMLTLLEAMKTGKVLRLSYEGRTGKFSSDMNLAGFRGSLFFMDDVQGRRGRTDALLAVGRAVPEGLDSKDIESIDDIPASIRSDFTAPGGSCTGGIAPEDIKRYSGFDISSSGTRLVLVPCSDGGAHNVGYALYRAYYDGALARISFPDIAEGKPSISEIEYNVDFDAVSRIMTAFQKDNAMATCGTWLKWQLTEDGNLVLLERRSGDECDDGNEGPETFPLEWPVK